jgi:hypothetical protein
MVKLAQTKPCRSTASQNPTNTLARDAALALWVDRWVSYSRAERIFSLWTTYCIYPLGCGRRTY